MAPVISFGVKTGRGALVDASGRDGCTTRAPNVAGGAVVLEEVAGIASAEELVAVVEVSMIGKVSNIRLLRGC